MRRSTRQAAATHVSELVHTPCRVGSFYRAFHVLRIFIYFLFVFIFFSDAHTKVKSNETCEIDAAAGSGGFTGQFQQSRNLGVAMNRMNRSCEMAGEGKTVVDQGKSPTRQEEVLIPP
jgi:hypothetical protein